MYGHGLQFRRRPTAGRTVGSGHDEKGRETGLLSRIPAFRSLSQVQLHALAARIAVSDFEREQVICSEARSDSGEVRMLLSGIARLVGVDSRGDECLIAVISRGFLFNFHRLRGELGLRLRWETLSCSRVGVISLNEFLKVLCLGNPAENDKILSELFGRAASLFGRYSGFFNLRLRQRIALALIELSEEIGIRGPHGALLMIKLPARLVAEMTGSSRPKVSLVLSDFERNGMVVRNRKRLIVDTPKLQALLATQQ
jgi:CRP-like cAMP-binding protein